MSRGGAGHVVVEGGASEAGSGQAAGEGPIVGGQGGAGGEGGAGADAPPRIVGKACDGTPFELDAELVRQCVVVTSCAPRGINYYQTSDCVAGSDGISFHFSGHTVGVPTQYEAALQTCNSLRDCGDVMACLGVRRATNAECPAGAVTRCEGDLGFTCDSSWHDDSVADCQQITGKTGTCTVVGEGSAARAECADTHTSYPRVPPAQGTCDQPGTASCEGPKIHVCAPGGVLYERDCSDSGDLLCVTGGGDQEQDRPWYDCAPAGCDVRFETFDQCQGNDLLLSFDFGLRVPVHCPDFGFRTCAGNHCAN